MNTDVKLKVTEIQRFCMHDGPGVRTTVFFKGCPMNCAWCHNPETKKLSSELMFYPSKCIGCGICSAICHNGAHIVGEERNIDREKCVACFSCVGECPTGALERCGTEMTVDQIVNAVERDRDFYGDNGGITLSGGEPFAQGNTILDLLIACKENGISTAVETCGYVNTDLLIKAFPYIDTFLFDIKDTDDERHRLYTGVSNELIIGNLMRINALNARIRLRCILVNGVNTDIKHYKKIADIARSINVLDGIDLLPYHAYGGTKAVFIGRNDNGNADWIPKTEQIEEARTFFDEIK